MEIKRYIVTQAVKANDNTLIPIWDDRIIFEKTKDYGNVITLKDDRHQHYNIVECIYDLKTKQLEIGVELDYYPNEKDLEFHKEELVLVETKHRVLAEAKIVDIVYEEYDLTICRGRKIDNYWLNYFKNVNIDAETLYAIKQWKPFFILDNGKKIEWVHQLYHIDRK